MAFLMMFSFFLGRFEAAGDLFLGRRPAQLFLQLGGGAPPLGQQLDHVGGDADGLGGVDQGALDRLLDPVAGVGAEAGVHRGVEALDGAQQAEVAFLDQVLQAQSLAGVAAGDVDDQAQVGPDHAIAGLAVAVLDAVGKLLFLLGVEQRGLVDLAEIGFQRRLDRIIP